jgi:hypothetical protein
MRSLAVLALVAAMFGNAGFGGEQVSTLLLAIGATVALSIARRLPPGVRR